MTRTRSILFSATVSILLATAPVAHGRLYRWVDEEGNVHYTDKIPPNQAKQAHDEMSDEGIRLHSVSRAKTQEEIAQEREIERLRAEQQRLIEKQKAEDRVLLRTFRSEDDLLLTRDGKLQAIDVMIKVTQSNIRRHQSKLSDLQRRAANLERGGHKVPEQLVESIETTNRSIEEGYASIVRREAEKEAIREVFARDRKRLRELKNLKPKEEVAAEHRVPKLPNNLFVCPDPATCDAAWSGAADFVRRHATRPLQMLGDNIIMSAAPVADTDIGITLSRIHDKNTGQLTLFMDLQCKESSGGKAFCAGEAAEAVRRAFRSEIAGE